MAMAQAVAVTIANSFTAFCFKLSAFLLFTFEFLI